MDLERQYELAMLIDCDIAFSRLIRLAGSVKAEIERRAAQIVVYPEAVREAYRPLHARGTAIIALAIETRLAEPNDADLAAAKEEVLRLLDHMKRGGL